MKNYNIETLAKDFIENLVDNHSETTEELKGKTPDEAYPFGNDSVDQDINTFLEVNEYKLSKNEKEELMEAIYTYVF